MSGQIIAEAPVGPQFGVCAACDRHTGYQLWFLIGEEPEGPMHPLLEECLACGAVSYTGNGHAT